MPKGDPFTALCQQTARPKYFGRADLHMHTVFSDGSYTPAQVVDLARRCGLSAIAITDHDTTAGLDPASAAPAGLEIIAGVEISAEHQGRELHLLGYFFDERNTDLQRGLAWLRTERVARFHAMVEKLRLTGIRVDAGELATNETLGRRHLAELLVKAGQAGSIRQAFQRFLGDRGRVNVPKCRMPVERAIALVKGAGGVAAWAHPPRQTTASCLRELRELGLGAVEADYPSCRPGFGKKLRLWAGELGMATTGGSDCHGPSATGGTLGTCGVSEQELGVLRERMGNG